MRAQAGAPRAEGPVGMTYVRRAAVASDHRRHRRAVGVLRLSPNRNAIHGSVRGMGDAKRLLVALDRSGYRLTRPRRAVAQLIADRAGHFAASDLITDARVSRLGIGRATIFRTLELLSELGVVERLELPSGEHAYVACEPVHHHHVVCSRCGRTVEIEDAGLRAVVRQIARRTGFRVDDHRLELFGLCAACLAAQPGPSSATA